MKEILKKFYHKTLIGNVFRFLYHKGKLYLFPEKLVVKHDYKRRMGKSLNLSNPTSLNEKINWLKLYDRRPIHTMCADKYEVRKYIAESIGEEYLIPLIFATEDPSEIRADNLPDYPVIIKPNHDSGGVYFIPKKDEADYATIQNQVRERLKRNYYYGSKEWQYKNIVPKVLVEKMLLDKKGNIPMDFKVHCFNGVSHMIQVDIGRGTENHYRNWYYADWSRCPFKWTVKIKGQYTNPADFDVPPPTSLAKMLELSSILAKPFDYVRVDWYNLDGALYFGEITFHHDSGYRPVEPEEWDIKLGQLIQLGEYTKRTME